MSSRDRAARGGRQPGADAIGADLAASDADLDLMMERVARLPDKRFYLIMILTDTALLSGVVLFTDELSALLGI